MIIEEIEQILKGNTPTKDNSYWRDVLGILIKNGHATKQYCCFLFMSRIIQKPPIGYDENKNINVVAFKQENGGYLIIKLKDNVFKGLEYSDLENIKALINTLN